MKTKHYTLLSGAHQSSTSAAIFAKRLVGELADIARPSIAQRLLLARVTQLERTARSVATSFAALNSVVNAK